jgi:hypothetical protein
MLRDIVHNEIPVHGRKAEMFALCLEEQTPHLEEEASRFFGVLSYDQ